METYRPFWFTLLHFFSCSKIWICLFIYLFYYIKIGEDWKIEGLFGYIIYKYNYLDIFIYLFIILKLERIGKLEDCLDIFIYYIKIGEDWKIEGLFGYIISKYNYLDIFYIYYLDIFIYLFIYLLY